MKKGLGEDSVDQLSMITFDTCQQLATIGLNAMKGRLNEVSESSTPVISSSSASVYFAHAAGDVWVLRGRFSKKKRPRSLAAVFIVTIVTKDQYNRKVTSTLICTATGLPSFIAGSNFHVFTASIAFSSSPRPRVRATRMSRARPSGPTTNHSTQVP